MSCKSPIRNIFHVALCGLGLFILSGCPPKDPVVTPEEPLSLFGATPTSGLTPLTVKFGDQSTPGTSPITVWLWDFGDGKTDTTQNPTHIYTKAGSFSVTLTVATAVGVSRSTRTNYITVRDPSAPRPNFSADVRAGSVPLEVAFTDLSEPGSSEITDWKWSFGDGATSTLQNPTHTYTKLGFFDVTLTTTSDVGETKTVKGKYITATAKDLTFGGAGVDRAFGITLRDDNRYVIVGDTLDPAGATRNLAVVTTDVAGNLGSQQNYAGAGDQSATAVLPLRDGGLYIAGTRTNDDGSTLALLYRTDTSGSRLWSKALGDDASQTANGVAPSVDDGAVIVGSSTAADDDGPQAWAARLDADGAVVWSLTYGPGRLNGVVARGSGWTFCGTSANGEDARVIRVGGDGSIAWDTAFGGIGKQTAAAIGVQPSGNYVVAGTQSLSDVNANAWVATVDQLGNPGWTYVYTKGGPSRAYALVARADGGVTIAGSARSTADALDDVLLASISASGALQWDKRFGGPNSDRAFALMQESDGAYAIAGSTESFGVAGTNMYLLRTSASGTQQNFPVAGRD